MSLEFNVDERQKALEFLQQFVADKADISENDTLPFRVVPFSIRPEELRGECIDWTLEYCRRSKCPEQLAAIITHEVTSNVCQTDLSDLKIEKEDQYDASKLARLVFNTVHQVCQKWKEEPPTFYKSSYTYETSVYAIKNTRRKMEDKHVIMPHFNSLFGLPKDSPNYAYFAVFDGHGGIDAATFAATHLHCFLAQNEHLIKDPGLALHETFQNTDCSFGARAISEGLRSGCTAVSILITNEALYLAWLGDSQAILCKDGEFIELMQPHKPERQDEKDRIEGLGGCVVWFGAWRVNGSLSVSRAIGDAEHKPFISGEPDVAEYALDGDEEFVILACDGLWDTVKPEQAIKLVKEHIASGNDRCDVAKVLVDEAKQEGSSDNISVLVVFLDAHRKEKKKNSSISTPVSNALVDKISESYRCARIGDGLENDEDSLGSLVAKVKVSTETTIEERTDNFSCKVTCTDDNHCMNEVKSEDNCHHSDIKTSDES